MMKILLSAFACAPNVGSEGGAGWHWANELAKHHEVFVLTDISRKASIEPCLNESTNPHIIYYRPCFLRKIPLNRYTARIIYSLWQYNLLPLARKLHNKHQFSLVIHLTYGVFRHPSFLGFLGIPFVFGPVGGGEDAPWRLKKSFPIKDKMAELVRTVLNLSAKCNPFLWLALSRAGLILVRTTETAKALPLPFQKKAIECQEIGAPPVRRISPVTARRTGETLKVLFAGRLLSLKGVHLALHAVAKARVAGADVQFTIIGSGPRLAWLKGIANNQIGLRGPDIQWLERVSQEQLFKFYEEAHCLLFPSLHDSGGNVVLEAITFGLPVICLDLGGPKTIVNEQCATIVNTLNCSESNVIDALALALVDLANNESKRLMMSRAAIDRAGEMSWQRRVSDALSLIQSEIL